MSRDVWERTRRVTIPLADVDTERLAIVPLSPLPDVRSRPAVNLHIVMADGKTFHVRQVLTEKGVTDTRDFQHHQEEVYFGDEQRALQVKRVLERMTTLVSSPDKAGDAIEIRTPTDRAPTR